MKTILVVDDSRIMRRIVKNTFDLLKIPCNYLEAGNGEEALGMLFSQPVNMILLDWNMPALSGIDFLKKVRSREEYKNIPIIMITSEAAKLNIIEAIKAGVTAYVTKPIDTKAFLEKISKISF
ncbi:MAG: response regulator [Treponema sp.]|jgi:two-component system chemotaxis response regulator CheY|nr:response regulator [Treponema sp.]